MDGFIEFCYDALYELAIANTILDEDYELFVSKPESVVGTDFIRPTRMRRHSHASCVRL